jgi:hypothetical protein
MSATVRRTAYALAAAVSALIALVVVTSAQADAAASSSFVKTKYFSNQATVYCPSGWVATGGGVGADTPSNTHVGRTEPVQDSARTPIGWKGNLKTSSGTGGSGTLYVICAR